MTFKSALLLTMFLTTALFTFANEGDPPESEEEKLLRRYMMMDSMENAIKFKKGIVMLDAANVKLNLPKGFKFIDSEQGRFIVEKIWNNPPDEGVLGLIVPKDWTLSADKSYAFIVSYEDVGYVKDDDAKEIDYTAMLKEIQSEEKADNEERVRNGYSTMHLVGWASSPFYDENRKVLHWAKEVRFGSDEGSPNTLNYEVRVLGRKGILSMNAVATMDELKLVKGEIDDVLDIAAFTDGNRYSDFDPGVDNVTEWTIGGLVAGKILSKAGFFALLAKNIKLIIAGIAALFGGIFFKKKQSAS
jgi:uncharacterized membrane-anchored protein